MSEDDPIEAPRTHLAIAVDHAAYAGHFPGLPILPGAVLLDEALHAIVQSRGIDVRKWRVASAKFLVPVRPGDALSVQWSASGETTIRFVIRAANQTVASGMLSHGA